MTNHNTTTAETWVLYWTGEGREDALEFPTNQDICSALGVSIPNALDPDGDELQELFFTDWFCADYRNDSAAYLVHKLATDRDISPAWVFQNRNDLWWFLEGVESAAEGDEDITSRFVWNLNNPNTADYEADLQSAFNDFVNDLCENDELAV